MSTSQPPRTFSTPAVTAGAGALPLVIALLAGCASAQGSAPPSPGARECTVSEMERFRLRDASGDQHYIEPRFVLSSGSDVFLLGKHSYRFNGDTVEPELLSRNTVTGMIVGPDAEVRPIPDPIAGAKLKPVAAAVVGAGTVGAVFLEFDSDADTLEWVSSARVRGAVQRIWYSEYRSGRWTAPEAIPMGESVSFNELGGSPLIVSGDTLVWAVPATSRDSTTYAAVFERVDGVWGKHILEREPFLPIVFAAGTHTPGQGFVLGLVRADTQPGYRVSSLFAYSRDSAWRRVRGVISGEPESVHFPVMARIGGDSVVITWIAATIDGRPRSRVMVGDILGGTNSFVSFTNSSVDGPVPLPGLPGVFWVSEESDGDRVIRVDRLRGSAVATLWQIPNPYTGYLGATATPDGILLSGPYFEPGRLLVSLLIRLRVQCE